MEFRNHGEVGDDSEIKEVNYELPSEVEETDSFESSDGKLVMDENSGSDRFKDFRNSLKIPEKAEEEQADGRLILTDINYDDSTESTGANSGRERGLPKEDGR